VRHIAALFVAATVGLASACDGGTGYRIEPLITSDTVDLAAPGSSADLPTALDVTSTGGFIAGGRFPERQQDAEQWDLAIRVRDGQVVFVPAGALGLSSNPGITHPLMGQSFDQVIEAPGTGSFVTDSAVVVQEGAVYVVRSRNFPCGFGRAAQYAKIQPLAVSAVDGTVRLRIATNEVCGDPRLVEQD
jgi:hypothetical protein